MALPTKSLQDEVFRTAVRCCRSTYASILLCFATGFAATACGSSSSDCDSTRTCGGGQSGTDAGGGSGGSSGDSGVAGSSGNGAADAGCPHTLCGSSCVDTQTSASNCGSCGNACATGATCQSGACVCPGGEAACSGVCVDANANADNCGRCGHSCLGGSCVGGKCQPVVLAADEYEIDGMVTDSSFVYWTSYHKQHVMRCALPSCAGGPQELAKTVGPAIGIAVDASHVYWSDWGKTSGTIDKCDPSNCAASMANIATAQQKPNDLVVTNTNAYWDSYEGGYVRSCSLGCTASTGQAVATSQSQLFGLVLADGALYWIVGNLAANGAINYCPLSGCNASSPPSLVAGIGKPSGLAADSSNIYWSSQSAQQILECNLPDCSNGATALAAGQAGVNAIAVDASGLYWTLGTAGEIASCTLPSCKTITTVASSLTTPRTIALSKEAIFVSEGGSLTMIAKP